MNQTNHQVNAYFVSVLEDGDADRFLYFLLTFKIHSKVIFINIIHNLISLSHYALNAPYHLLKNRNVSLTESSPPPRNHSFSTKISILTAKVCVGSLPWIPVLCFFLLFWHLHSLLLVCISID